MHRLIEGYRRFRRGRWQRLRALHRKLAAEGQSPHVMVITCADSRLDPATIFDALPGELFVVRNVANLVPPYEEKEGLHGTSAAIEFAVQKLGVDTILVLGHVQCGGVAAALEPAELHAGTFMGAWIDLLRRRKPASPMIVKIHRRRWSGSQSGYRLSACVPFLSWRAPCRRNG